jgi:hypothetical protein
LVCAELVVREQLFPAAFFRIGGRDSEAMIRGSDAGRSLSRPTFEVVTRRLAGMSVQDRLTNKERPWPTSLVGRFGSETQPTEQGRATTPDIGIFNDISPSTSQSPISDPALAAYAKFAALLDSIEAFRIANHGNSAG